MKQIINAEVHFFRINQNLSKKFVSQSRCSFCTVCECELSLTCQINKNVYCDLLPILAYDILTFHISSYLMLIHPLMYVQTITPNNIYICGHGAINKVMKKNNTECKTGIIYKNTQHCIYINL